MYNEKTLTLTLEQARDLYSKTTDNALKDLLLANFTKEELKKKALPKSWDELRYPLHGYYINSVSNVSSCGFGVTVFSDNKSVFATQKQAKSALAMAQLSQLMKVYNGGWEPDWEDEDQYKYVINRYKDELHITEFSSCFEFLSFRTPEIRDVFLKNFEPLIKEYFMI